MEIKTTHEIWKNHYHNDEYDAPSLACDIKWISVNSEFIEMHRLLKSFMTNGYGEHRDFRNVGTDYEGREKVFKYFLELYKQIK